MTAMPKYDIPIEILKRKITLADLEQFANEADVTFQVSSFGIQIATFNLDQIDFNQLALETDRFLSEQESEEVYDEL